jgi:hypothetical protein
MNIQDNDCGHEQLFDVVNIYNLTMTIHPVVEVSQYAIPANVYDGRWHTASAFLFSTLTTEYTYLSNWKFSTNYKPNHYKHACTMLFH